MHGLGFCDVKPVLEIGTSRPLKSAKGANGEQRFLLIAKSSYEFIALPLKCLGTQVNGVKNNVVLFIDL